MDSITQAIAHLDLPDWVWTRAIPIGLGIILFSPRGVLLFLLVLVGFAGGVVFGGGILGAASGDASAAAQVEMAAIDEKLRRFELGADQSAANVKDDKDDKPLPQIPIKIDEALDRLIHLILKDFVLSWYNPINYSKSDEFANSVQSSLHSGLATFGFAAAKTKIVNAISPISQTLIRHIYEYRHFEASSLPLEAYLDKHPLSTFHKYSDSKETNKFLRRISAHIVMATMPKSDRESPVVFSLMREIVATSVLGSIVESYSDPDYLNQLLIGYIRDQQKLAAQRAAQEGSTSYQLSNNPKPLKSTVRNGYGDQLFIKIVEAKHLPLGQGSIFCRIQYDANELRSEKLTAETHPMWMEDFAFDWNSKLSARESILVEIYDSRLLRDELIGCVSIPVKSLEANKYVKEWYPIDTSDSRIANSAFMSQIFLETMVISISNLDDGRPLNNVSEVLSKEMNVPENEEFQSAETLLSESVENLAPGKESAATDTGLPLLVALQQPLLKQGFEGYLQNSNSLGYLQLYSAIVNLEPEISVDEARTVFDIFYASPGLSAKVEKHILDALNSDIFDDASSKDTKISSSVFDSVKMAVVAELDDSWIHFKATDVFKQLQVVSLEPNIPTVTPSKPPRVANNIPPPLPSREPDAVKAPPPLPPRESDETSKREEEDLKLAFALQQEEYKLANRAPTARSSSLSADSVSQISQDPESTTAGLLNDISLLKERIYQIDQKLRSPSGTAEAPELLSMKLELQGQVERLTESLHDVDPDFILVPAVNLFHAVISISDVTDDNFLEGPQKMAERLVFCIEVQPASNVSGWVLTKTFAEFNTCYNLLVLEFPRIKNSAYPGLYYQLDLLSHLPMHERAALAKEVEVWVRGLLDDKNLSQSPALLDLLQPDHLKHKVSVRKRTPKREEISVEDQVLNVFKSAGSVLSNVVISTGNAINNVLDELEAPAPPPTKPKREGSVLKSNNLPSRTSSLTPDTPAVPKAAPPPLPSRDPSSTLKAQQPETKSLSRAKSPSPEPKKPVVHELSSSELAILLECAFGVIEEVFNLSDPNQWMRQKGLQVVKSVLRNNYATTISTMIQSQADEIRSVEAVSGYLNLLSDSLWPNGEWYYTSAEYLAKLESDKVNPRSDAQRTDTRMEAKTLLVNNASLLGYEGIQTVLGKQNTGMGMSRLFNMLQHRELNRGLICAILEALVRSILSE
ncbi:PXA-domain-containing protein [Rhizoclosmatium globosum]|uniref:PXA-domain-containing protein n=1 Tax=Rhizoclosmatium globosum TaxID=329046 RepID=A0A1Y2CC59_9FUNG|nr:PXA-domain-containing protein [Rhizoclosmatium globosum]|eukprot:ORY44516.1 PXA-domain-containing protein [Rhizoclosmatium globosum]